MEPISRTVACVRYAPFTITPARPRGAFLRTTPFQRLTGIWNAGATLLPVHPELRKVFGQTHLYADNTPASALLDDLRGALPESRRNLLQQRRHQASDACSRPA